MAVTNVGISALASESTDYINGYRVYAGDADKPLYLKWRTMSGADANVSFDISVDYRYVPRGTSEDCCWTDWNGAGWTNIAVSECNGQQTGGESGWQWSLDLATLLDLCGLKEAFTDGTAFGFGSRKFDLAHLQVNIKSQMSNGKASPRTDTQLWLGYFPEYGIERVYCDSVNEVKVEYSAPGWERVDDRWSLEALDVNGASLMLDSKPWGTVVRHSASGNGTVVIPVEKLAKAAPIGDNVHIKLNFNAAYRQSGEDFASAETTLECEVNANCNTPKLTLWEEDGIVHVTVADSGDKSEPIQSAIVKLDGSEFAFDQQVLEAGETAAFPYLPRKRGLSFTAVATGASGTISEAVAAASPALPAMGALTLVSLADPDLKASAKYNVKLDDDYSAERQMIKLAGRNRPSACYGEGGNASWSLSFDIPPEAYIKDDSERESAWLDIAASGDCVMFLDDGSRRCVSADRVRSSRRFDKKAKSASVSLTEVSA